MDEEETVQTVYTRSAGASSATADVQWNEVDSTLLVEDDLFEMKTALLPLVDKWKEIGLAMGFGPVVFDIIDAKCSGNVRLSLQEMLIEYVRSNYNSERFGTPSWQNLTKAVAHEAGGNDLEKAQEIAKDHPIRAIKDTKLASTQEEDVYSVGSPTHLLKYAWYHGKLSSEEANQLLTSMEGSCFLVREDKDSFGSILLSVKSDEGVSHFIINRGPGWYRVDGTSKQFEVVADLLAHYRNYSLTKAVLGSPCLRASNQSISTETVVMSTRKESVYTVGCPTHLLKYAWYHGKLSNEEANQLLTSMEGSCFLVREDKDNVGSMVLSVKSEEKVSHFVINRGPGWYEVDGTSKRFELVAELLTHYRNNFLTDNSHFLLGSPCQKRIDQSNSTDPNLGPTQEEPLYSVGSPIHLLKYAWYHGALSKEEANQLLTSMEGSCFLVREDKDNVGSIVLSVKSEEGMSHFIINRGPGWYQVDGASQQFELLADLLVNYQSNSLTDNPKVVLGSPFLNNIDQSISEDPNPGPIQEDTLYSVGSPIHLLKHTWYHGALSNEEAHQLLTSMEGSCFLIREDKDSVGSMLLSVKTDERVSHFIINRGPGWYEVDGTSKQFELVADLVVYYQSNSLTDNPMILLGSPCLKATIQPILSDQRSRATPEEPLYSVGTPIHLLKYAWYHGKLSSEEATQLLTSMEGSCFLVREDTDNVSSIVLSVKSDEGVSHFPISRGPGWYKVDGISKQYEFVADLVTHYQSNSLTGNSNVFLGSPCCRPLTDSSDDPTYSTVADEIIYHQGQPVDLIKHGWFSGKLSERKAHEKLSAASELRFLVWFDEASMIHLSLKHLQKEVSHLRIERGPGWYSVEGTFQVFPSIPDLVQYYNLDQFPNDAREASYCNLNGSILSAIVQGSQNIYDYVTVQSTQLHVYESMLFGVEKKMGVNIQEGDNSEPLYETINLSQEKEPVYESIRQAEVVDDPLHYTSCSEDEIDESDSGTGLDLTAPPPESWFHGSINRATGNKRLQMSGFTSSYLVRERISVPGDYVLSFLSNTGSIHHFVICSACGDCYIGGRHFFKLADLIGFYSNCSAILEGEKLEVPVFPPVPVPLYRMIKATTGHVKDPNTDELFVDPGEVFQLLTSLSCDWGWGKSQKTGQSGLIPLNIMEDMTDGDPNLGKPWFYESISRHEAVDIVQKSTVGSYLVRLSGSAASQDKGPGASEIRYSLAVRLPDGVQRFLITRYVSGHYVFGGRPFNLIEDIFDRYSEELIAVGVKLVAPVPKPTISVRPNLLPCTKTFNLTMVPNSKIGTMELKKGKNSPVDAKWNEVFFVLRCNENKLLFYESAKSVCTKDLVDLIHCKVYVVHPSLYSRKYCFVVMLHYLNEVIFYYISAGDHETAKEFYQLIQQCIKQSSKEETLETEQSRSLSVTISECTLSKTYSQVFGLLFLDGVCLGRTQSLSSPPYVFDETFIFENILPTTETFSFQVCTCTRMFGKRKSLGSISIKLTSLRNDNEREHWRQLVCETSQASQGAIKLSINFDDDASLPSSSS